MRFPGSYLRDEADKGAHIGANSQNDIDRRAIVGVAGAVGRRSWVKGGRPRLRKRLNGGPRPRCGEGRGRGKHS